MLLYVIDDKQINGCLHDKIILTQIKQGSLSPTSVPVIFLIYFVSLKFYVAQDSNYRIEVNDSPPIVDFFIGITIIKTLILSKI